MASEGAPEMSTSGPSPTPNEAGSLGSPHAISFRIRTEMGENKDMSEEEVNMMVRNAMSAARTQALQPSSPLAFDGNSKGNDAAYQRSPPPNTMKYSPIVPKNIRASSDPATASTEHGMFHEENEMSMLAAALGSSSVDAMATTTREIRKTTRDVIKGLGLALTKCEDREYEVYTNDVRDDTVESFRAKSMEERDYVQTFRDNSFDDEDPIEGFRAISSDNTREEEGGEEEDEDEEEWGVEEEKKSNRPLVSDDVQTDRANTNEIISKSDDIVRSMEMKIARAELDAALDGIQGTSASYSTISNETKEVNVEVIKPDEKEKSARADTTVSKGNIDEAAQLEEAGEANTEVINPDEEEESARADTIVSKGNIDEAAQLEKTPDSFEDAVACIANEFNDGNGDGEVSEEGTVLDEEPQELVTKVVMENEKETMARREGETQEDERSQYTEESLHSERIAIETNERDAEYEDRNGVNDEPVAMEESGSKFDEDVVFSAEYLRRERDDIKTNKVEVECANGAKREEMSEEDDASEYTEETVSNAGSIFGETETMAVVDISQTTQTPDVCAKVEVEGISEVVAAGTKESTQELYAADPHSEMDEVNEIKRDKETECANGSTRGEEVVEEDDDVSEYTEETVSDAGSLSAETETMAFAHINQTNQTSDVLAKVEVEGIREGVATDSKERAPGLCDAKQQDQGPDCGNQVTSKEDKSRRSDRYSPVEHEESSAMSPVGSVQHWWTDNDLESTSHQVAKDDHEHCNERSEKMEPESTIEVSVVQDDHEHFKERSFKMEPECASVSASVPSVSAFKMEPESASVSLSVPSVSASVSSASSTIEVSAVQDDYEHFKERSYKMEPESTSVSVSVPSVSAFKMEPESASVSLSVPSVSASVSLASASFSLASASAASATSTTPTTSASASSVYSNRSSSISIEARNACAHPPKPMTPKAPEEILLDNTNVFTPIQIRWIEPKPELKSLLLAAKDGSIVRRSNACGALKVLTSKKTSQVRLAQTRGVLDALVFAASDMHDGRNAECSIEARTRAVIAIAHLSEPKETRVLLFQHLFLVECLVKVIKEDKCEARMNACRILAMMSKATQIKGSLVQVRNLVSTLSGMLRGLCDQEKFSVAVSSNESYEIAFKNISRSSGSSQSSDSELYNDDIGQRLTKESSAKPVIDCSWQLHDGRYQEYLSLARLNCCAAFTHLAKECCAAADLCRSKVFLESIVAVCKDFDNPMHTRCMEIFCHLTRFSGNSPILTSRESVIKLLVSCGNARKMEDRLWAVRSIQNLASDTASRIALATDPVLILLTASAVRGVPDEQNAALGALLNISYEPGAIVPLTNTKNLVATLVHVTHNTEPSSDSCHMACDTLAVIGAWMQTLAGVARAPDGEPRQPSQATTGWLKWE